MNMALNAKIAISIYVSLLMLGSWCGELDKVQTLRGWQRHLILLSSSHRCLSFFAPLSPAQSLHEGHAT